MTATELREVLDRLDMTQTDLAEELDRGVRTVQAWCLGEAPVPGPVERLLTIWDRRPEIYRARVHDPEEEDVRAAG